MSKWQYSEQDGFYYLLGVSYCEAPADEKYEKLAVFDLNATEIYVRTAKEGEKPKTARKPVFPAEWENQFGLPVEEHRKQLQVNIFKGYTVFGIREHKEPTDGAAVDNSTGGEA